MGRVWAPTSHGDGDGEMKLDGFTIQKRVRASPFHPPPGQRKPRRVIRAIEKVLALHKANPGLT